jgi:hypothetical protein
MADEKKQKDSLAVYACTGIGAVVCIAIFKALGFGGAIGGGLGGLIGALLGNAAYKFYLGIKH